MIKLSKEATEPHDLKQAWPELLLVVLVLGAAGAYEIWARHVPEVRYYGAILFLNVCAAHLFYTVARVGWRAISWPYYGYMAGLFLMMSQYIFPKSFAAASPVQALASFAVCLSLAPRFFTLCRRSEKAEPARGDAAPG